MQTKERPTQCGEIRMSQDLNDTTQFEARTLLRVLQTLMILVMSVVFTEKLSAQSITPNEMNASAAEAWAKLVLVGVDTEFPNKLSLVYSNADQIRTPRENFPAFYGCFDWHSSVHGHWVLVRLLKRYPQIESAAKIRETLSRHLTAENLRQEADFFSLDEQKTFERMYGWAWLFRLAIELDDWDDPDAVMWRNNLRPLEEVLLARTRAYLPLLTFPIRTGQHPDTGFALGQILDYARAMKLNELEVQVIGRAKEFYASDVAYPVQYEPSGHDFFSSCWNEADLMRRVLPQDKFALWLDRFVPELANQLTDGTISPVPVSDVTDPKIVHLAGLNLNRAWCLRSVAEAFEPSHPIHARLLDSATAHLQAGLGYINSGHYEGDHWLATFGLYAVERIGTRDAQR
ncbi:MAG: DUF2891 domain-containing protein [Planctomycetales bacterium]|nr:DUF2891 domain-containing protein [Planctomycetales bacterium]